MRSESQKLCIYIQLLSLRAIRRCSNAEYYHWIYGESKVKMVVIERSCLKMVLHYYIGTVNGNYDNEFAIMYTDEKIERSENFGYN